jgi:hypothetical protein
VDGIHLLIQQGDLNLFSFFHFHSLTPLLLTASAIYAKNFNRRDIRFPRNAASEHYTGALPVDIVARLPIRKNGAMQTCTPPEM